LDKLFDGTYGIDHILSWSHFCDNFYVNLTLCTAPANRNKSNRTLHEYMSGEAIDWKNFVLRIEARPGPKEFNSMKVIKKQNYLIKNTKEK